MSTQQKTQQEVESEKEVFTQYNSLPLKERVYISTFMYAEQISELQRIKHKLASSHKKQMSEINQRIKIMREAIGENKQRIQASFDG